MANSIPTPDAPAQDLSPRGRLKGRIAEILKDAHIKIETRVVGIMVWVDEYTESLAAERDEAQSVAPPELTTAETAPAELDDDEAGEYVPPDMMERADARAMRAVENAKATSPGAAGDAVRPVLSDDTIEAIVYAVLNTGHVDSAKAAVRAVLEGGHAP